MCASITVRELGNKLRLTGLNTVQQFDESAFQDFLSPGISLRDVDALFPLLQSANVIQALIALFRGGGEEVMIRLAVLREIAARADTPERASQQLTGN